MRRVVPLQRGPGAPGARRPRRVALCRAPSRAAGPVGHQAPLARGHGAEHPRLAAAGRCAAARAACRGPAVSGLRAGRAAGGRASPPGRAGRGTRGARVPGDPGRGRAARGRGLRALHRSRRGSVPGPGAGDRRGHRPGALRPSPVGRTDDHRRGRGAGLERALHEAGRRRPAVGHADGGPGVGARYGARLGGRPAGRDERAPAAPRDAGGARRVRRPGRGPGRRWAHPGLRALGSRSGHAGGGGRGGGLCPGAAALAGGPVARLGRQQRAQRHRGEPGRRQPRDERQRPFVR
jgi:hypothetical protein